MTLFRQIGAVGRITLLGLPSRARMSLATALSVGLVTLVLLGFLAMAAGFRDTVAGSGSTESAVILAEGAASEFNSAIDARKLALLDGAPGIAVEHGKKLVSAESYSMVALMQRNGQESSVTLRGIGPLGLAVRPMAQLMVGRMFEPGRNELVVGRAISERYQGLGLGQKIKLGGGDWSVVGVFGARGSVMESEIWADQRLVAQFFGSDSAVQSVRLRLTSPEAIASLQKYFAVDPTANLSVKSERDYYARQARGTGNLILYIGWPLGIAMAIGALAGALNTMFTSVSARVGEITTLRMLGFSGGAIFVGTMIEATMIVLVGALGGVVIARLFLHGFQASTVGANLTQVMFTFELTAYSIAQALLLALVVGVIGGAFPAWRAARQPLVSVVSG